MTGRRVLDQGVSRLRLSNGICFWSRSYPRLLLQKFLLPFPLRDSGDLIRQPCEYALRFFEEPASLGRSAGDHLKARDRPADYCERSLTIQIASVLLR